MADESKGMRILLLAIGIAVGSVGVAAWRAGAFGDQKPAPASRVETPNNSRTSSLPTSSSESSLSENATTAGADHSSKEVEDPTAGESYQPSNEVIEPYEISKNPYRLRGHSGILDTVRVAVVDGMGHSVPVPYPGGSLRFERMIDERTATYEVMVGRGDIMPDGEIAVSLPDSNPPDSSRLWRIFVEGPMRGVNGFGSTMQVTVVRFEGYYIPPPKPAAVPATESEESSATDSNSPRRIGGGVSAPQLIYSAEPEFSEEARKAKIAGNVLVNLWVDTSGNPSHIHVIRGVGHGLDEKAVEAVRQYRFKPATENGKPVLVELNVEVNFQIF